MAYLYAKYPSDVRNPVFDYGKICKDAAGTLIDPVVSAVVTADAGLTVNTSAPYPVIGDSTVKSQLSGGTAGTTYLVHCDATLTSGQIVRINMQVFIRAATDV